MSQQLHNGSLGALIEKRNELAYELASAVEADHLTEWYLALEERMVAVQGEIDERRWSESRRS